MLRAESFVFPSEADVNNKLMEGWERAESKNGIPYYINHVAERTQWDHPIFQKTMEELGDLNTIKYAAYRTASKLQLLQKRCKFHELMSRPKLRSMSAMDLLELHTVSTVFDKHGFGMNTDLTMEVLELDAILTDICRKTRKDRAAAFDPDLVAELILNLLMNMFDPQRRGSIRAVSCKVALATLCNARLGEKYKFYFRHLSENGTMIMRQKFSTFLQDMMAIPEVLKESRPFGGRNVQATVDSCFQTVANGIGVHEEWFHDWLYQEPQCLVWLHTMHRMNAAQSVSHSSKCATCRITPIVGFRYKCLKCFKYNLCQQCFFTSKTSKRHKITHPIQEYCLNATSKEDTKAFVKMIRNNLVKDYKRRDPLTLTRYTATSPAVDQSLAWDDYVGVEDENDDAVQDQEGLHRAESVDDDVISYLGLDPRHSRIIYPDDEDQVPRYIVKTEISEPSVSGDERAKSVSSAEEGRSMHSATSSLSVAGSQASSQRRESVPPAPPMDSDDGLTLPADKVKQLYDIIYKLEDENKVLLDELESVQDQQSDMVSLSDTRETFSRMRLREEVFQARQDILESHNQRLMEQIQKLRAVVENQEPQTTRLPLRPIQHPAVTSLKNGKFNMSTPKDAPSKPTHILKTPNFASPVFGNFADALKTVEYDVTMDETIMTEGELGGRTHCSLPSMTMGGEEVDELEFLVRKLNEEIPEEYSRCQDLDGTDKPGEEDVSEDSPMEAARMMGEAMSQFVDKLQIES